ncbi:hypothetical protein OAO01_02350, partial [Oligoflexia bacterium]|nr:hypothetical protein [Oligoflexia bacterium]
QSVATSTGKKVLGLWDGHDCGAALVVDDQLICAINEERLSRRKLEVGFPQLSIQEVLKQSGVLAHEIDTVAFSTSDFAKTLSRFFPALQEEYYQLRRRQKRAGRLARYKKLLKYKLTEIPSTYLTSKLTRYIVQRRLCRYGLKHAEPRLVNHHAAHAATAAFTAPFAEGLVLTIDGIGDGSSGSIAVLKDGKLHRHVELPGHASLGIFYEHVTNLLGMRELEDEGKVMALADVAAPIPNSKNPLLSFFSVAGLNINARYSSLRMYRELKRVLTNYTAEQFAYLAQRALEAHIIALVKNALNVTGQRKISYSGGVASNIKVNLLIRELDEVDDLYVFPHMGDGGLAVGAALWSNYIERNISSYNIPDLFFGPGYSQAEVVELLSNRPGYHVLQVEDAIKAAALLILQGEVLIWYVGKMEYGPRALGSRSIIARADSLELRDRLNLELKERAWYQPFCPSLLERDAREIFLDFKGSPDRFMTSAYRVKLDMRERIKGVIGGDGTCRPQIVSEDSGSPFAQLLRAVREATGLGVVLNTSLNRHGEPMACSPCEALQMFAEIDLQYMFIEGILVTKSHSEGA